MLLVLLIDNSVACDVAALLALVSVAVVVGASNVANEATVDGAAG